MLTVQTGLLMFGCAVLGSLVQSLTGFGAGIMMMIFIPSFLPVLQGSAVSGLVTVPFMISLIYTYRKSVRLDYMIRPTIFYMIASAVTVKIAVGRDFSQIKLLFGIVLVILAIYFSFFSDKLKVKAGWPSAIICGTLSGVCSGLFGIGGPPMVIFFMALTGDDKETYLGTIQAFFLVTAFYVAGVRIVNGIFTVDLIPFILLGMVGGICGKLVGTRIMKHVNTALMKKLVYAFLGVAGVINIVSNI